MDTQDNWIWTAEPCPDTACLVYFRKQIEWEKLSEKAMVQIAADARYKLYINGLLIETGSSKGDRSVRYMDAVDAAPFLHAGKNTLAVAVLHYGKNWGNHSLFPMEMPGLYISGAFSADTTWRCRVERGVSFCAEEEGFAPLCIHEYAAGNKDTLGWRKPDFDDSAWPFAVPAEPDIPLTLRTIPFMRRQAPVLLPEGSMTVPAHSEKSVTLDALEEMTAYLSLAFLGGAGAEVELLEAECYSIPMGVGFAKRNRLDRERGVLTGYSDVYRVLGTGTADEPEVYEPYWWRTFRFLRVTIRTAGEPLTLRGVSYAETGYPLDVKTSVETSDKSLAPIWDISLRTLRRCMHETYMDCPFYEQLQYAMDTRSEILYTYAVSADDRLARQAIDDFRRAQRPDGLLNCSYPNRETNVIPGFSIYYILMVHDHMMYFGDKALVEKNLPAIDHILRFFDRHRTADGLVDKIGGVNGKAPFWSFIDWAREWMPTEGMPTAGLYGPITMESLLYLMGLQAAAELREYVGMDAADYRERASRLSDSIRVHCMDMDGMLTDGIGGGGLSQQTQVFGVLTGVLTEVEGQCNLLRTLEDKSITRCTVAMCFYLFRALEQTGLYAYTDRYWDIWRAMVANGCTTCVEAEDYARSECHAWGAVSLYELPSVTLGVRPAAPGFAKIAVQPVPGYMTGASGTVHTPHGDVHVAWEKRGDELRVKVDCDEALKERIVTK